MTPSRKMETTSLRAERRNPQPTMFHRKGDCFVATLLAMTRSLLLDSIARFAATVRPQIRGGLKSSYRASNRHPREGGIDKSSNDAADKWVPAFAGKAERRSA